MSRPVLAAGLLVTMAGAWYWALQPPTSPRGPATAATGPTPGVDAFPSVGLERLATRVAPPLPTDMARDPFRSGRLRPTGAPSPPALRDAAAPDDASASDGSPAHAWPRVDLIGIAEGKIGDTVARTAIVSGPHGVHHVRAGDLLEGVYRVERVAETGLELRLVPEDRVLRLALRP